MGSDQVFEFFTKAEFEEGFDRTQNLQANMMELLKINPKETIALLFIGQDTLV